MSKSGDSDSDSNPLVVRPLFASLLAAVSSAVILYFVGRVFGAWGFLIAAFVVMLSIEQIRRTSNLNSLVRVGAAVGLLLGWLLHRHI